MSGTQCGLCRPRVPHLPCPGLVGSLQSQVSEDDLSGSNYHGVIVGGVFMADTDFCKLNVVCDYIFFCHVGLSES